MGPILHFLNSWRELIISIFGKYPLAAALLTVVAIGLFIWLQKSYANRTVGNLFIIFTAWAIAVPVLGTLFDIIGEAWEVVKSASALFFGTGRSYYEIYAKHPVLILCIFCLGAIAFGVWQFLRPEVSRALKIVCVLLLVVIAGFVAGPIAEVFHPTSTSDQSNKVKRNSPTTVPPKNTPATPR